MMHLSGHVSNNAGLCAISPSGVLWSSTSLTLYPGVCELLGAEKNRVDPIFLVVAHHDDMTMPPHLRAQVRGKFKLDPNRRHWTA
jgi:hypothetical protein